MPEAEHLKLAVQFDKRRLKWLRWLVALGRIGGPKDGSRKPDKEPRQ